MSTSLPKPVCLETVTEMNEMNEVNISNNPPDSIQTNEKPIMSLRNPPENLYRVIALCC